MEGYLAVPPDRGTILGRALWKTRFVVLGGPHREVTSEDIRAQLMSGGRVSVRSQPHHPPIYLSVYKSPDDWEPVQSYAVCNIIDCKIQMIAHRKQGPVLPTLVINIAPDPASDKLRKRRSSRAAGLVTSGKESNTNTLWFRLGQDEREGGHTLQDWANCIQDAIPQPDRGAISPLSPNSPSYGKSPFGSRQHGDAAEYIQNRPPSLRAALQQKTTSNQTTSTTRERPATFSDSLSLRSRRSNNSSISGIMNTSHIHTSMQPGDLSSLATSNGEYQGTFIEGWTKAKGRSSTLSSPVWDTRNSMESNTPAPMSPPPPIESDVYPIPPRESILDRAFQLRYIPGSEQGMPGEEKLTSLARFDALMRHADEQRKLREEREEARRRPLPPPLTTQVSKSAWDLDSDSDNDLVEMDFDDQDDDTDARVAREDDLEDDDAVIPPQSRKALKSGARQRTQHSSSPHANEGLRSPISYNSESLVALSGTSQTRPQTGVGRRRPTYSQRTQSQSYTTGGLNSFGFDAASPGAKMSSVVEDGGINAALQRSATCTTEKRQSVSSNKRLSFTDFTRRLSSTSSLILVQTNQSNASSFSEPEVQSQNQLATTRLSISASRGPSPFPLSVEQEHALQDKKCGWRGSMGVFGNEGGFL